MRGGGWAGGQVYRGDYQLTVEAQPWYTAGGQIALSDVAAVYQPIGAEDLARSLGNIAHPGRLTTRLGLMQFDPVVGWVLPYHSFLETDIVPGPGWSAIVRSDRFGLDLTEYGDLRAGCFFGSATDDDSFTIGYGVGEAGCLGYGCGGYLETRPMLTSGVLAITPGLAWQNGQIDGEIGAWTGTISRPLIIGGYMYQDGAVYGKMTGTIQAMAFYRIDVAAYVPELTAAAAALGV